jgi:acyl-CoA reductase-like NAD-dependent aldehyde dehydrogenase
MLRGARFAWHGVCVTGQVDINGGAWNMNAPFCGYKQSGYGWKNFRGRVRNTLKSLCNWRCPNRCSFDGGPS